MTIWWKGWRSKISNDLINALWRILKMTDSIVTHFINPNERKVTKCNYYYLIIAREYASDCVRIEWFRANNWVSDITLIPRLFPRVQRLKIGNFLQIFSGHFTGSDFELIFWMSFANYPIQTKTLRLSHSCLHKVYIDQEGPKVRSYSRYVHWLSNDPY